jgi:hypothetical protein
MTTNCKIGSIPLSNQYILDNDNPGVYQGLAVVSVICMIHF